MSEANETNQAKPDFKIESCESCVVNSICCNYEYNINYYEHCQERKNIEALVNGKR